MKRIYLYPNFDYPVLFNIIRVAGAGLGNLLYDFANVLVMREMYEESQIIWPEWNSIKLGPFLRNERDKRLYRKLFINNGTFVRGCKRLKLLSNGEKYYTDSVEIPLSELNDGTVVMFSNRNYSFEGLYGFRDIIKSTLLSITRKKYKNYDPKEFDKAVCVHIRLGDFADPSKKRLDAGAVSTALPISWYVKSVESLKEILPGDVKYFVFSDERDDALGDILSVEGVERRYYGSAISDMLAMSESKLILHTWSTFALWSRFLGNVSGITYPTFIKESICDEDYTHFTMGSLDGSVDEKYINQIQMIFKDK